MYNVVSTSWSSQPYTGGSYTAIGKGGSQADIEKMAEPLTVRVNKTNKVSLEGNIPTFQHSPSKFLLDLYTSRNTTFSVDI